MIASYTVNHAIYPYMQGDAEKMLRKGKTKAKLSQRTYLFNAHLPNSCAIEFSNLLTV
jgi:hypothetical protein